MITIDELKMKLGGFETAVGDLRDALSIEASEKRVAELEHQMTVPGFFDDQEKSQKVYAEMSDLKGKLERYNKLSTQYEEAQTLLEMLEEENDPALIPEGEEAVDSVEKAIDELQLMTMLNGEYDHANAILTFHAGTGGTEAQDWADMLLRMYKRWADAHGYAVEILDVLDGDEAGIKSASMMDAVVSDAAARGVTTVVGWYYPTAKNAMVRDYSSSNNCTIPFIISDVIRLTRIGNHRDFRTSKLNSL